MYRKQVSILKSYPVEITDVKQMYDSEGNPPPYFDKVLVKIKEILERGTTQRLVDLLAGSEGRRRQGSLHSILALILTLI